LTSANQSEKIDRHPERHYKAGFEARLLPEVEEEHKGLRKNQRTELMGKEFEKHPYIIRQMLGECRYQGEGKDEGGTKAVGEMSIILFTAL